MGEFPQGWLVWWEAFSKNPLWQLFCLAVTGFGALWGGGKVIASILRWRSRRLNERLVRELEMKTNIRSFTDEEIGDARRHYIEPDCSNLDPSNETDMRNAVGVRESVFRVLDRELSVGGTRHVLVLADSGMGKTTLLLNFFAREQRKAPYKRRHVAMVPLGRQDALDQIKAIENPRETILLLDAFDEDQEAIHNYQTRLDTVMRASADFRDVVLTCRTQFFADDSKVPTKTGIQRVGPRRAGISGAYEFRRLYLQPFSNNKIRAYINSVFPFWQLGRRKAASAVIKKIPELAVRPMLLALVPDLVSSHLQIHELWDLYEFMIDSWLKREEAWIKPDQLMRISITIAVDLVVNRELRRTERISPEELTRLLVMSRESIESWKLTTRSLLNRDASGAYKFAHRSIMEFLFVKAFIGGQDACADLEWTDMMCDLFLSWGRSKTDEGAHHRSEQIMEMDLSKTKLFPLPIAIESTVLLDSQWVKRVFAGGISIGVQNGLPSLWRRYTSRVLRCGDMVRVYELAEGIVWQWVRTNDFTSYDEVSLYYVDRNESKWQDPSPQEKVWGLPLLTELRSLLDILSAEVSISDYIDDRALYWLADSDEDSVYATRIRTLGSNREDAVDLPGWRFLQSVTRAGGSASYVVDVYKATIRGISMPMQKARALPIITFRGDAYDVWSDDVADPRADQGKWCLQYSGPHPETAWSAISRLVETRKTRSIQERGERVKPASK